jgi:hypothetical protein
MPIESIQSIHLKSDGSGQVFRQVFFRPAITKVVSWLGRKFGNLSIDFPLNEKKLQAAASNMGSGVSFLAAQPQKNEKGWEGYGVVYSFEDINRLQIEHGPDDSHDSKERITFSLNDRNLEIRLPQGNPTFESDHSHQTNSDSTQLPGWIMQFFDGFHIATALIAENGIAQTNASFVNKNSIVLLDFALSPFLEEGELPNIFEKLQEAKNLEDLKSIVGEIEGIRIEMQPVIRVTLN